MDIILIKTGKNKVEVFDEEKHGVLPEQHITVKGISSEPKMVEPVNQLLKVIKKTVGAGFHVASEETILSDNIIVDKFFPEKETNTVDLPYTVHNFDTLLPDAKHTALSLLEISGEKIEKSFTNLKKVREKYEQLIKNNGDLTPQQRKTLAEDFQTVYEEVSSAITFTENAQTQADESTKMVNGWVYHTLNNEGKLSYFRRNTNDVQLLIQLMNPVKISGKLETMFDVFDNMNLHGAENVNVEAVVFTTGGYIKPEYSIKMTAEGWMSIPDEHVEEMNSLMDRESELISRKATKIGERMFKLADEIGKWNETKN